MPDCRATHYADVVDVFAHVTQPRTAAATSYAARSAWTLSRSPSSSTCYDLGSWVWAAAAPLRCSRT